MSKSKGLALVFLVTTLYSSFAFSFRDATSESEDVGVSFGDRDREKESTFEKEDYTISNYRAGIKPIPGVPLNQILGDTPPPAGNTMSRMMDNGGLMGDHD